MHAHRLEKIGIAAAAFALIVVPEAIHGWPSTVAGNAFTMLLLAGVLALTGWRERPRTVTLIGAACLFGATLLGAHAWFPDTALPVMTFLAAVAALAWNGRAAWVAAGGFAAYLLAFWLVLAGGSPIGLLMVSVPGFLAGTVLRLRRETADELTRRGQELEEERELFAEIALRHERARIAAELHDIVGHAISVMVIQAAAGQRLVDHDPAAAKETFTAIADSARQGKEDLRRLVELLGGTEVGGSDLSLIEEVVTRAARSGFDVSCRFEGDRDGVAERTAHVAFRIVQESLTNALRHAPGASVRIVVAGTGRNLTVRVENSQPTEERPNLSGTGRGLTGLRERTHGLGGQLQAGPTLDGGWLVAATLPGT